MSLRVKLSKSGVLGAAAAAIIVLNLLDALFTIGFVQLGAAEEANPLMAGALSSSPLAFMIVKLSLVSLCVMLLWRLQSHRSAHAALYTGAGVYTLLLAYHISSVQTVTNYLAAQ